MSLVLRWWCDVCHSNRKGNILSLLITGSPFGTLQLEVGSWMNPGNERFKDASAQLKGAAKVISASVKSMRL